MHCRISVYAMYQLGQLSLAESHKNPLTSMEDPITFYKRESIGLEPQAMSALEKINEYRSYFKLTNWIMN